MTAMSDRSARLQQAPSWCMECHPPDHLSADLFVVFGEGKARMWRGMLRHDKREIAPHAISAFIARDVR
jgi:hypothetical protein